MSIAVAHGAGRERPLKHADCVLTLVFKRWGRELRLGPVRGGALRPRKCWANNHGGRRAKLFVDGLDGLLQRRRGNAKQSRVRPRNIALATGSDQVRGLRPTSAPWGLSTTTAQATGRALSQRLHIRGMIEGRCTGSVLLRLPERCGTRTLRRISSGRWGRLAPCERAFPTQTLMLRANSAADFRRLLAPVFGEEV